MTAISEQLPALLGVAVGATLSFLGSAISERIRWKREHTTRWDKSRLDALVAYANALKQEAQLCLRMHAFTVGGLPSDVPPLDPSTGYAQLIAAEDHRASLFESLLLLADAGTVGAARAWQEAVWLLFPFVDPGTTRAPEGDFLDAFRAAGRARDSFYASARRSLGISGALTSPPYQPGSPTAAQSSGNVSS